MTLENLKKILMKNKPNVSMGTVKTYISNLSMLSKELNEPLLEPSDFVKHKDKIIEYIKQIKSLQGGKTKLSAIMSVLKPHDVKVEDLEKDTKDAMNEYTILMRRLKEIYENHSSNQEMSDIQKSNFLPWEDILKIHSKLSKIATPLFKVDPKEASKDVIDILKHYVLLSLYVLIPPRRSVDYTVMKYKNFDESDGSKDNYYKERKRNKYVFVFNNYKNATRLGTQVVEVPPNLRKIINDWIKFIPDSDYIIPNKDNQQIQHNKINYMLNQIFKRNIGASLLRHSYITHKYGDINLNEMKNDAEALGQADITTLLKYVDLEEGIKKK